MKEERKPKGEEGGALSGMIRAYLALYLLFGVIALCIGQCAAGS